MASGASTSGLRKLKKPTESETSGQEPLEIWVNEAEVRNVNT